MRRNDEFVAHVVMGFLLALIALWFLLYGKDAFSQQAEPGPTPTGSDPEEWSEWLNDAEDVEVMLIEDYDPILTYGGSYSVPRLFVKQSIEHDVAVEIELGYTEVPAPIDPEMLGGLAYQGEVVTELTEPVARGALGDPKKPDAPGPRPRPTRPPEVRPVPGGRDEQGREIRDVVISDRKTPGSVRKEARRVSGVRLVEPIEGPVKIERTPWHSSYSVRQGPVFVTVEVAE